MLRASKWLVALTCLGMFCPGAWGGILLDLESVPLGTVLTNGVGRFQHTNSKHSSTDAFLTTQNDHDGDGYVAAFNGASANPTGNPEAIFGGGKTHTIQLGDIPTTTDGFFRVFLFDANQNQSEVDDHVDIEMLKVYTSSLGTLTDLTQLGTSLAPQVYDMDSFKDYTLRVDGSVGTGGADMNFYLPNSVFSGPGVNNSTFIYLYYQYTNFNDGPDAWMLDRDFTYTNPEVPEPASMALWFAGGTAGLIWRNRRKRVAQA